MALAPQPRSRQAAAAATAAAAAAALVVATVAASDTPRPRSAEALQLVPAPINAYAQRRQEKAYQAYMQQLEQRFEETKAADFKKVVEAGGGGLGVSYRVAGVAAFIASAASTAVVHPLDTIKTRTQARATRVGRRRAEKAAALRGAMEAGIGVGLPPEGGGGAVEAVGAASATGVASTEAGTGATRATGSAHATACLSAPTVERSVASQVEVIEMEDDAEEPIDLSGLYNGITSNIMKEAPNAAIYLGVYELLKDFLLSTTAFHNLPLLVFVIAGALGDALGSIVRCPAEIVNKRLQLGVNADATSAIREAFFTAEGRQSSFVAWGAVLWRDVPYGGLQIALYEFGRLQVLSNPSAMLGLQPGLLADVILGAAAGMIAAMITTPADVLVTRLSVQNPQSYLETRRYMGVGSTLRRIVRDEGPYSLFSGVLQRGIYYAPLIGLFFAIYESTRTVVADPQTIVVAFLNFQERLGSLPHMLHDLVTR